jgi:dihydroorotate dehydrogenase (NAD+) catalytic subunit
MGSVVTSAGSVVSRAASLATRVGSLELPSPVLTASGTSGHGAELQAYFDLSAIGAVVVKSLAIFPWPGNPAPRIAGVPGGLLNSVGLQGPGLSVWAREHLPRLLACKARVVVSLWGRTVEDFEEAGSSLARICSHAKDIPMTDGGIVALEVNVSCPNVEARGQLFGESPDATAAATKACKVAGVPVWVKLSATAGSLLEVGAAALEAGAEALVLLNTLSASGRGILGSEQAGLSGPALGPVALRAVADCRGAFPQAGIVGVGGVRNVRHAISLLGAGADAIEVGTATLVDPRAAIRVQRGLVQWLEKSGAETLARALKGG